MCLIKSMAAADTCKQQRVRERTRQKRAAYILPNATVKLILSFDDALEHAIAALIEGMLTAEQDIENDSHRPNVHFVIVALVSVLVEHLRREIGGSAAHSGHDGALTHQTRQTKVTQFDDKGTFL